jgi:peroxiredoxin
MIKSEAIVGVPNMVFKTRVRDESIGGDNPYRWQDVSTDELFGGKKILLFSLPGAFTPTCSTFQLPDYEKMYDEFIEAGVDDVYCISVNDAFVMNAWGKQQGVEKVKMIPDGSGHFTRRMGMLVDKDNLGFGMRSWRYAAIFDSGSVLQFFPEPGRDDNHPNDPYMISKPQHMIKEVKNVFK